MYKIFAAVMVLSNPHRSFFFFFFHFRIATTSSLRHTEKTNEYDDLELGSWEIRSRHHAGTSRSQGANEDLER